MKIASARFCKPPNTYWRLDKYGNMIKEITNLGDAALLIPASALLFCHLCWRGDRERAISFALAIGVCLAITLLAKLACILLGANCFSPSLHSPSGHASFSAAFYGCCAALTVSGDATWRQRFIWIAVISLIAAIALSRVWVGAHTFLEAAIGLVIGFGCIRLFLRLTEESRPAIRLTPIALSLAILAIGLQGTHLTIEPLLQIVADRFAHASKCSPPSSFAAWRNNAPQAGSNYASTI
jgi:membrane-associated phospholipid phosphatase